MAVLATALVLPLVAACDDDLEPNLPEQERLQQALDDAVATPDVLLPGAIVHVHDPAYAPWSGAAGLGEIGEFSPGSAGDVAMRPHDKFRAGSIMKSFLAAVTLQHVEEGTLSLAQTLPELLPDAVTGRIPNADRITLRMLLNHTSGIAEWLTPDVLVLILDDPRRIWTADDYIAFAAALPPVFEPGESWSYSNTNYTVLGRVLERAAGQSWRSQVRQRIIEPLGLEDTGLPEPGDPTITGDHTHGYDDIGGQILDLTYMDPSMAGAAGGHALVTTAADLGQFLDALLAGSLFTDDDSLIEMTTMVEAPQVEHDMPHFYGLGVESFTLPDGTEVIGHSGSTGGHAVMMFRATEHDTTIVAATNTGDFANNFIHLFIPAVQAVTADSQ